jgi:predicted transcriptional regulator
MNLDKYKAKRQLTVRLSDQLADQFTIACEVRGRTVAEVLRQLISDFVRSGNHDDQRGKN